MIAGILRCLDIYMGDRIKPGKHEDMDILWQPLTQVIETIEYRNKTRVVWGWKDPNCAAYIQEVMRLLVNPRFVYVKRNVNDAMHSDLRRNPKTKQDAVIKRNTAFTHTYNLIATQYPTTIIQYEHAIEFPDECVAQIAQHVQESVTDEQINRAIRFVRPGQYRNLPRKRR
jgi:hypothetical protein